MTRSLSIILLILIINLLFSFTGVDPFKKTPFDLKIPIGFPEPYIPEDNPLTQEKVLLGKKLFYDKILSRDQSISCASCHVPSRSFTDEKSISIGVGGSIGERNSMPIINLAWSNSFFWDGGVPTLELQALKPLTSHVEMKMETDEAVQRLTENKTYLKLFKDAFGEKPTATNLLKAIASFERTLISGNSRFDQYFYQKDTSVFNDSEKNGYRIFFDDNYKMHCATCHSGVNFTNNSFQNNALYLQYEDEGRYKITGRNDDKGKFKVPTLRNIAVTAPYMHDGSLKTLEEVIEHYNTGGKGRWHPNKSPHVHVHRGFELTHEEKKDLVNFLKTLTDEEFLNNPEFLPQ